MKLFYDCEKIENILKDYSYRGRKIMLNYYYTKEKDRLYVYDYESGYFMRFNKYTKKWEIPFSSFMQVDHDNDDFTVISEEDAKKMTNGASFEEDYYKFISAINSVRNPEDKK